MEPTKTMRKTNILPVQKKHFELSDMIVRISCWNVKSLGNPTKFSLKLINETKELVILSTF